MARRKPAQVKLIHDMAEADAALRVLCELNRKIAGIEARMNEQIDALKESASASVAPLRAQIATIEAGLVAFCEYTKEEAFKTARSRELTYGVLGFRRGTRLLPHTKKKWADVLDRIEQLHLTDALRVKTSVAKDVLREWPDERLDTVYVRRVEKDTFFYELKAQVLDGEAAPTNPDRL